MKITLEVDSIDDEDKAQRLIRCDEAFYKLSEIDSIIRNHKQHGQKKDASNVIESIGHVIWESSLLEIYR